ncbi:putative acetolactate synthase large subunit [Hyaloraphidium curvatum]|nr:putative acetolactate synthase large subunit [Hyaloraphidium curvatum]
MPLSEPGDAPPLACEFVVEQLVRWGVDTFFVLQGGAIAPFVDAVARNPRAHLVCFQHEHAAADAADGYFRACGKPACVAVTSGPGVQNALNGLCGLFYDSVPALLLTGQVNVKESLRAVTARPRQVGFQEMPVVEAFGQFAKHAAHLASPDEVVTQLHKAMVSAMTGRRGPSVLDFPVNVQMTPLDGFPGYLDDLELPPAPENPLPIAEITIHLQRAERPVVILGNGARDAAAAARAFLKRTGCPAVLTWGAFDVLPADDPLNLGAIGVYGDRVANLAVQNADLLLAIGARLDTRQTGGNLSLFSKASRKIAVDIDPEEPARLQERGVALDHAVACDASRFLALAMPAEGDPRFPPGKHAPWLVSVASWRAQLPAEPRAAREGGVSPYAFLSSLPLPNDATVAIDTGATLIWCMQSLLPRAGQRVYSSLANSSMGYALAAALGSAVACPGRHVVAVLGDGGMQQTVGELATLRRLSPDLKVVVVNNAGYGIIAGFQDSYLGGRRAGTGAGDLYGDCGAPDFAAIAAAYGLPSLRVLPTTPPSEVEGFFAQEGPGLLEVVVHPEQAIAPKVEFGNGLDNMSPAVDVGGLGLPVPPAPRLEGKGGWRRV